MGPLQMTVQCSNAVLFAALTYVSNFAVHVNLPMKAPSAVSEVRYANIITRGDNLDLGIWLTNGYWFGVCGEGYIGSFRAPSDPIYNEDGPGVTHGPDHMTTNDAVAMARGILAKLGYSPKASHSIEAPTVEGPIDSPNGHLPYCRVTWSWPSGIRPWLCDYIAIDIDIGTKTYVGSEMFFGLTNLIPSHPLRKVDFEKCQSGLTSNAIAEKMGLGSSRSANAGLRRKP